MDELQPNDYQRLFRVQGLRFLITDIWMGYYKLKRTLVVFSEDHFTSYLPKKVIQETLQEGLDLFLSKELFSYFRRDFLDYMSHAEKRGKEIVDKRSVTVEECREFFNLLSDLFVYYTKTELFYTDEAYHQSQDNEILYNNLKELGELKNEGRERLNKFFFGKEGYLNRILITLNHIFAVSVQELWDYSREEIYDLFDGKRISAKRLQERSCFVFQGTGNDVQIAVGVEAKDVAKRFEEEMKDNISEVNGIIAHKGNGKVCGKARIIKAGYDNYDQLQSIISRMNKGDILFSETTSPDLLQACHKAAAIVTDQGGMLSHAAITSRELGIPCIVGTMRGTAVFKDEDFVEVDAENGIVRKVVEK